MVACVDCTHIQPTQGQQTVFTMSMFALGLLVPAGWIMYHIPVYRQTPPS
ncbi:hypothetical protein C0J45_7894 [Silurus meridionalis]|nr:hypothetical protein C0J45_7894 [Silurus meridionalis]